MVSLADLKKIMNNRKMDALTGYSECRTPADGHPIGFITYSRISPLAISNDFVTGLSKRSFISRMISH